MANLPDCTLTTGCFLLNKYNPHSRTIEDTIKGMETLLSVPCYLVIYCNAPLEEHIRNKRESYNLSSLTKIIVKEVEELWAYQFADKIRENRETYWPTRDARVSVESMVVVFNKFNLVLNTIRENPFNTSKFGWIDGSLGLNGSKICAEGNFNNLLLYNLTNVTDKFHLQILNVEDKKYKLDEFKREFYQQARWVAVGCFFITPANIGIKILTRLQEVVAHTIQLGYGHGEEYYYLEVLDEFYDDIYRGYGDFKDTLNNFIRPTKNLVYIYWQIVMRYFGFGYFKECVEACYSIIASFDNFQTELNYDMYVRIYSALYLSLLHIDTEKANIVGQIIKKYYHTHPIFRQNFDNLRHLCGMSDFCLS